MNSTYEEASARACWFVGAAYPGLGDQTQRFVEEGVWQCGEGGVYDDKVKSIQIGDRIAIKSTYIRKRDLPFDNRGHCVSVMGIKATGTVLENLGDGQTLKVDWHQFDNKREWYFFTSRHTVWKVSPDTWMREALIEFAFEGKEQDVTRFCRDPFWRERFGDTTEDKRRFGWTRFYEAVADKLLQYRNRRDELITGIHAIASKDDGSTYLQDQFAGRLIRAFEGHLPIYNHGDIQSRKLSGKSHENCSRGEQPTWGNRTRPRVI